MASAALGIPASLLALAEQPQAASGNDEGILRLSITNPAGPVFRGSLFLIRAENGVRQIIPIEKAEAEWRKSRDVLSVSYGRLKAGKYSFELRAPGYKSVQEVKKGVVVKEVQKDVTIKPGETVDLDFGKLEPDLAKLTVSVPNGIAGTPVLEKAKTILSEDKTQWIPSATEFEPAAAVSLAPGKSDKSKPEDLRVFQAELPAWNYRVAMQGAGPDPVRQEVDLLTTRTRDVAFTVAQLTAKPKFMVELKPAGRDDLYSFQLTQNGDFKRTFRANETVEVPAAGEYQIELFEGVGRPNIPVWRGRIEQTQKQNIPLFPAEFGHARLFINADFRPKVEVAEPGGLFKSLDVNITTEARDAQGLYYVWVEAAKSSRVRVTYPDNGEASQPEPVTVDYLGSKVLGPFKAEQFKNGHARVRVAPGRRDAGALSVKFQGPVPVPDVQLSGGTQELALPAGNYRGFVVSAVVNGTSRTVSSSTPFRIVADASRGVMTPIEINAQDFFDGKLEILASDIADPLVIDATPESGGAPIRLKANESNTLMEGDYTVVAKLKDKVSEKKATVSWGPKGKSVSFSSDDFFKGTLVIFTSDGGRKELARVRGPDGASVEVPWSSPEADQELSSKFPGLPFDAGIYRVEVPGLAEGNWTLTAQGQSKVVFVSGAKKQAVVIFDAPQLTKDVEERVRGKPFNVAIADGAHGGASVSGAANTTTSTLPTKPRDVEPVKEPPPKHPKEPVSSEPKVEIWDVANKADYTIYIVLPGGSGRTITAHRVEAMKGWLADATIADDNGMPRNFSYTEAQDFLDQLTAANKKIPPGYQFDFPTYEQWHNMAGELSDDTRQKGVFARTAPVAVTSGLPLRGNFYHLFGNVWQWVKADRDANGKERLRVVGGSWRTKLDKFELLSPDYSSLIHSAEKRMDNVGLRPALVPIAGSSGGGP